MQNGDFFIGLFDVVQKKYLVEVVEIEKYTEIKSRKIQEATNFVLNKKRIHYLHYHHELTERPI